MQSNVVNLTYIALHNSLSIKRFHFTASNQKTVADFGNRRARGGPFRELATAASDL